MIALNHQFTPAAYRLQQGDEALSYQAMKSALGEPKSAVPSDRDAAVSPSGWWLRGVGLLGVVVFVAAAVVVELLRRSPLKRLV